MLKKNTELNKAMGKAGELYLRTASNCLMTWWSGMTREEYSELLGRGDMRELEVYVRAESSIRAGAASIRKSIVDLCGCEYSLDEFTDIILWSDTPIEDFEELNLKIQSLHLTGERKAAIALEALHAIHDAWIRKYPEKFEDPKRADKQFMFMPLELIGVEEAMKDYIFIIDTLSVLGLIVERRDVEERYREQRRWYRGYMGLTNKDTITDFIRLDIDPKSPLPNRILKLMEDGETAELIAEQVIEHSGEPSTW